MGARRRFLGFNAMCGLLVLLHGLVATRREDEAARDCAAHRARLQAALTRVKLPGATGAFAQGYATLGYRRVWPREPGTIPEVGRHLSLEGGRVRCTHHSP